MFNERTPTLGPKAQKRKFFAETEFWVKNRSCIELIKAQKFSKSQKSAYYLMAYSKP